MLFRFAKHLGIDNIEDGLYGQEINPTNHALLRTNMLLHGVPFEKFDIRIGCTLMDPQHLDVQPVDVIMAELKTDGLVSQASPPQSVRRVLANCTHSALYVSTDRSASPVKPWPAVGHR